MGHRQQVGKPSRYVTSHINRYTTWCISPMFVVTLAV